LGHLSTGRKSASRNVGDELQREGRMGMNVKTKVKAGSAVWGS